MENRVLEVFYGADGKPYKDQERSVLFPVVGNEYQGANDFTHIRFYYQRLCGEDNTLVAVFKNAKGQLGCRPLSTSTDSTRNEKYALLPISDFLTQYKGDIYIALQCYRGDADAITWDSDNNMWVLNTQVPTIRSTANIKMSVNYAPLIVGGGEEDLLTLQILLSYIAEKSNIDDVVIVVGDISMEDLSGYDVGQLFYDNYTHTYYQKTAISPYYTKALSGMGVLGAPNILCRSDDSTRTIAQLHTIYGDSAYLVLRYLDKDYLYFSKKTSSTYTCVAFDIEEQRFYKASGLSGSALPSTMLIPANKIEIASKLWVQNFLTENYVPYNGANTDVELGGHYIGAKEVHLPNSKIRTDSVDYNATLLDGKFLYDSEHTDYTEDERAVASVKYALEQHIELTTSDGGSFNATQYAYISKHNATIVDKSGKTYRFINEDDSNIYYGCFNGETNTSIGATEIRLGSILKVAKTPSDNAYDFVIQEANLEVYSTSQAKSTFATSLTASINNTNYVMTIKLKNANGVDLATQTIDLPLESIVSSATYYDEYTYDGTTYTKVIVITLSTTSVPTIVPVGDLISGLEKEACVEIDEPSGTFTQDQMNTLALDNAKIKLGGVYYHKSSNNSFSHTACDVQTILGTTINSVVTSTIYVNSNTMAYNLEEKSMVLYSKSQVDTIVQGLQDGIDTNAHDIDTLEGDIAKLKKDVDYALKYPLLYGTPTTDTEEEVGLTTSQLPATTLPKGLINYVGGMSQKVNQLVRNGNFEQQGLWSSYNQSNTTILIENNTLSQTFLSEGSGYNYGVIQGLTFRPIIDHKYLISLRINTPVAGDYGVDFDNTPSGKTFNVASPNTWEKHDIIASATSGISNSFILEPISGTNVPQGGVVKYKNIILSDLTDIYGAGNEPTSTSDPRIQWLIHYLTENPQYDEGSIVNAPVEKLSSKGFNIWNEEWRNGYYGTQGTFTSDSNYVACKNLIACSPNTTYFVNNNKIGRTCFYDKNGTFISTIISYPNNLLTTPYNCYYLAFDMLSSYGTTYNHDVCINISGTMNGTYLPYQAPSDYPIPAEVQALDGYGLGIDDTIYNYIDFERKKFVKKVNRVKLEDCTIVYDSETQRFIVDIPNIKEGQGRTLPLIISGYDIKTNVEVFDINWNMVAYNGFSQASILLHNHTYTTVADLKSNEGEKYIYYPLATPTETDISEYLDRDFPNENLIDTYQGGEVEFENDNDMSVHYSLTYQYKVE